MGEWQPIATAPKVPDKPILVWVKNNGPAIVSWNVDSYTEPCWDNWMEGMEYGLPLRYEPTHWMDIPMESAEHPYANGTGTFTVWEMSQKA